MYDVSTQQRIPSQKNAGDYELRNNTIFIFTIIIYSALSRNYYLNYLQQRYGWRSGLADALRDTGSIPAQKKYQLVPMAYRHVCERIHDTGEISSKANFLIIIKTTYQYVESQ